ncbi:16S rRNA-processing protein RimM [compost metagenome]
MVGMEVWDGGVNLGSVGQVINQGFTRFLEVGDRNVLIPINGPFIKSISKTKKKIEVELPEGFLDI